MPTSLTDIHAAIKAARSLQEDMLNMFEEYAKNIPQNKDWNTIDDRCGTVSYSAIVASGSFILHPTYYNFKAQAKELVDNYFGKSKDFESFLIKTQRFYQYSCRSLQYQKGIGCNFRPEVHDLFKKFVKSVIPEEILLEELPENKIKRERREKLFS